MCNRPSLPSPFLLDTVCTQPTVRIWKNKSQNMEDSIKLSEVFVIKVTAKNWLTFWTGNNHQIQ